MEISLDHAITADTKKPRLFAIFAGQSGHGKSAATASFAKYHKTSVISMDERYRGWWGCRDFLGTDFKKNVSLQLFNDIFAEDRMEAVRKMCEIWSTKTRQQMTFNTLALEELSVMTELLLLNSMKLRGAWDSKTKADSSGKVRGAVPFEGPDDHNYLKNAMRIFFYQYVMPLKIQHLIVSAWTINVYKRDPQRPYDPPEIAGEKLNMSDAAMQRAMGIFDECWFFEKEDTGVGTNRMKYTVSFEGTLAKTAFPQLKNLGKVDVTGLDFYLWLAGKIPSKNNKTLKEPVVEVPDGLS